MEEQTRQLDQNISVLLDNYELNHCKFNQAHREHALFITSADFSTKSSSRASHKAIIAAQLQKKIIILELTSTQTKHIIDALTPILPLCHVITGTKKDFQATTALSSINAALQKIRDKSYAVLVLKQEGKNYKIFDRLDTIKLT